MVSDGAIEDTLPKLRINCDVNARPIRHGKTLRTFGTHQVRLCDITHVRFSPTVTIGLTRIGRKFSSNSGSDAASLSAVDRPAGYGWQDPVCSERGCKSSWWKPPCVRATLGADIVCRLLLEKKKQTEPTGGKKKNNQHNTR